MDTEVDADIVVDDDIDSGVDAVVAVYILENLIPFLPKHPSVSYQVASLVWAVYKIVALSHQYNPGIVALFLPNLQLRVDFFVVAVVEYHF